MTFDGQVEDNLSPVMQVILPKIRPSNKRRNAQNPYIWGPIACLMLPVDPVSGTASYQCALRGRGWQRGQLYAERFMNASRRIGVAHRPHGLPSWP